MNRGEGVRAAVVGCGTAATRIHLPLLRAEGVAVTVFASRTRASAEAARDAWGEGTVVDRWEDAVRREDVDLVVVATPNAHHRDVAVAAAGAGKHVLVDKPLARTVAEADEIIAAAERAAVVVVPFQNSRFAAPFVAAGDAVRSGRIGEVVAIRAAFGHGGPQGWAPAARWFFDPVESGGGCLIDLGVHIVDTVHDVTGQGIVEVAAAVSGRGAGTVETDAQLLVRLAGGGAGTIHTSWSSPAGTDHQLTVVGTAASLHLDGRTPLTLLGPNGERERLALPDDTSNPLRELLAAVAGERLPSVTARDGRAAVAVVETAYRAARERRWVHVPVPVP